MKTKRIIKGLLVFTAFFGMLVFGGYAAYYAPPAYSMGFNIGVSTPNVAFSFGEGVNTYYAPAYGAYIYGYNGSYYRWYNGGWIYANVYGGPWYPVTAGIYLPGILAFGPPPPTMGNEQYYSWWSNNVGPWYRTHHPGWWGRHHAFMRNYSQWRSHVNHGYGNRPFRHGGQIHRGQMQGPAYRGPAQRGQMQGPAYRGPAQRGQMQGPAYRGPAQRGQMQGRPAQNIYHPSQGRSNRGPVQGPAYRGQAQRGQVQGRPAYNKGQPQKGRAQKGQARGGKKKKNNNR